ncbi:uncharacterized protein [Physcomitrium patens]|uniref:uncharacterized protein n=1 Tax=Physcomitrium patens TaxID=3218 RepID=UPI000D15CF52|nr:uncharacterized protein LOC112294411 isoform X2 [Physcomitrium patens]|eukprot:XP_024400539.1 uncharacterized protein LOC112294411 isoform X2 [Physcomitrella patens]
MPQQPVRILFWLFLSTVRDCCLFGECAPECNSSICYKGIAPDCYLELQLQTHLVLELELRVEAECNQILVWSVVGDEILSFPYSRFDSAFPQFRSRCSTYGKGLSSCGHGVELEGAKERNVR